MKTVAVIPTYNEAENLHVLIDKLMNLAPEIDVLIVDDSSPDGTGQEADRLASLYKDSIHVLHRASKDGLGRAYVAGFKWALLNGYEAIVQMDADMSHDPAYIAHFIQCLEDADLVLGSRYVNGISVIEWDFSRLILSKMASFYVQMLTSMPVMDPTGGFKCWRSASLQKIDLESLFSNGYMFQIETTYKAFTQGMRIIETPIVFADRSLGVSKMSFDIVKEAVFGVARLRCSNLFSGGHGSVVSKANTLLRSTR